MNKKLLKTLTGLAIVGTALGAAFAYIKNVKKSMTSVRRTLMICGMVKKKTRKSAAAPRAAATPRFLQIRLFLKTKNI